MQTQKGQCCIGNDVRELKNLLLSIRREKEKTFEIASPFYESLVKPGV